MPRPSPCRRLAVAAALAQLAAASAASAQAEDEPLEPRRTEPGLLPAINYDSDLGFGLGAVTSVARFHEAYDPYRWRLEALLYATLKKAPGGGLELPHHDDYLKLDLPGLLDGKLRLALRVAFARRITTGYYGIGNASEQREAPTEAVPRFYQYRRTHPSADVKARIPLLEAAAGSLELTLQTRLTYNRMGLYAGSKLERDTQGEGGPIARRILVGTTDHGELLGAVGLLWDGRDHEFAPRNGMLHELSLRSGAGLGLPFGYFGVTADVRFYAGLYEDYLVLATRVLTDLLFGRPPVYELGIGGASQIRGVPSNRFHGKAKLVGNVELRSKFWWFDIGEQRFVLGALAFADAGRVWSEIPAHRALDGQGLDLAVGLGGGLRLQWGETFVIRGDVGYSPTEGTTGIYLDVGHIF